MTSHVSVGRARSSFFSTTALPRVQAEGALRILLAGPRAAAIASVVRRMSPEPALTVVPELPRVAVPETDVILLGLDAHVVEPGAGIDALLRAAGWSAVVAVVGGEAPAVRPLLSRLREDGVTHAMAESELGPALLDALLPHLVDKRRLEGELSGLRERFALALRGAVDGAWEWDLVKQRAYFSQRSCEILGIEPAALRGSPEDWLGRIHAADAARVRAELDAHLAGRTPVFQSEHRMRNGHGEEIWVLVRGLAQHGPGGKAARVAGSMTDVTAYRQREQEVRAQSRHDAITDLPRQQVFHERLARAVEVRKSYPDYGFAVLMIQVDRFRLIRDSLGKDGADRALALIAERVTACVSPDEVVCRYGDDKFAILLENVDDPGSGTALADRIHRAFDAQFEVDGQRLYVSVSIGMTSSAREYDSVDDLITDVSSATDHARESQNRGDARQWLFSTNMRIEATTLLQLEMALREAVERQEFQLAYQPVVAVATGRLVGFEALLRWHSPTRGRVSPGEFIPVAENTGLIVPIGRWAIREAVRQLQTWDDEFELAGRLSLAVNVSARQLGDAELVRTLAGALAASRIAPSCIKLELTESVLMERAEAATEIVQRLRATGVRLYVDDFGTGYSSLSYLHRFPVDGLKIDKSFVDELDGSAPSGVIIQTILDMARNLRLDVVAEGIEQGRQLEQLRGLGCPHGQGYLWAAPLSPGEAYAAIARAFPGDGRGTGTRGP
jgi:diguanylate cyclase (GGDEF)-like protein/PAS domain S-box-containing protein